MLRRFNFFTLNSENKSALKLTIISALLLGVFVTPIATSILKTAEHVIDKIFEDEELKEIEKNKLKSETERNKAEIEKMKAETENIKLDAEAKRQKLFKSTVIKKKRSNFYEALEKYPIARICSTIARKFFPGRQRESTKIKHKETSPYI